MSSWLDTIDPDVRQVLEDVTKDRKSKLFRLDRSRPARAPFAEIEPVSARSAGWRPAERHLLETYREEVWLLVHAAYIRKVACDPGASAISPCSKGQVARANRAGQSQLAKTFENPNRHAFGGRNILEAIASDAPLEGLPYERFVEAGKALLDSPSTRLIGAIVDLWSLRLEPALEVAQQVGNASIRPEIVTVAKGVEGVAKSRLGEHHGATLAFQAAAVQESESVHAWTSYLLAAVVSEDFGGIEQASARLDDLVPSHGEDWASLLTQYRVQRDLGQLLTLNREDRSAILGALGASAREIVNVLLN